MDAVPYAQACLTASFCPRDLLLSLKILYGSGRWKVESGEVRCNNPL